MRKARTFAALAGASALVVSAEFAKAQVQWGQELFATQADFGGSQYAPGGSEVAVVNGTPTTVTGPGSVPAGQPQQTNNVGIGFYETSGTLEGTVAPIDSLGDPIVYNNTSLGGQSFTTNGLGNLDNYNPPSTTGHSPDANLGVSWAGLTSPTGSMGIEEYSGGYSVSTTGEMINDYPSTSVESAASKAFVTALTSATCLSYDITAPGGGTTITGSYFETSFETYDNNGGFNASGHNQVNPTTTLANKNTNSYGTGSGLTIGNDDPGSFAIQHGTGAGSYWTVYLPYSFGNTVYGGNAAGAAAYAASLTYLQFALEVNGGACPEGTVTVDDIHTVSPTWAASGSGLSWNTAGDVSYSNPINAPNNSGNGYLATSPNWVGGPNGYGVPNGSGMSATFGDLETGNASVGLDANQTVGILNFNSLNYQYTLTPSSTGSSTAGNLVMDNTVNSADAQINDIAGGQASTNYTEYVAVPVVLNSNTDVTVTRSTDTLTITGNITGTGALSMNGAGTLQLNANNTYSGGTTVNSGTLLVSNSGALPANKPVTVTGGLMQLASGIQGSNLTLSSLSISGAGKVQLADNVSAGTPYGTSNVTLDSLSITGNGVLDIANNRVIIDYTTGNDPIASIATWIKNGFYNLAGPQIISSDIATADSSTGFSYAIGYADGADGEVAGLPSGEIELMFTLVGDANLDGTVNAEDYTPFSHNLGESGRYWDDGDFNYDGTVNAEDYTPFSHDLGQSASLAAAAGPLIGANGLDIASVPEPASVGLLVTAAMGVLARRRARRTS
jgi:autotransporter-associated beta strand protein